MELIGKKINEKYLITKKIDDDILSTLWKGIDVINKKNVIIRLLTQSNDKLRIEDLIKFNNDSNLISGLKHPNINRILETAQYNDHTFNVLEIFQGARLSEHLSDIESPITSKKEIQTGGQCPAFEFCFGFGYRFRYFFGKQNCESLWEL